MNGAGLLLAGLSLALGTEVYRWVDSEGTVHYADQPIPGAERVIVEPAPAVPFDELPLESGAAPDQRAQQAPAPDYRIAIANLQAGETVWNDARELDIQLSVVPPLAPGHHIVIYLDGEPKGGAFREPHILLRNINRGPHSLWAEIVDGQGRTLAKTEPLTIYHRQHSVANPH